MPCRTPLLALWLLALSPAVAMAAGPLLGGARPLVAQQGAYAGEGPSLFAGLEQGGLFAPLPQRRTHSDAAQRVPRRDLTTEAVYSEWIRGLIAKAEAGAAG